MPAPTDRATLPHIAYVTLWFPKPSETFIAREVADLRAAGLPVNVTALYGHWRGEISPALGADGVAVERMGIYSLGAVIAAVAWWLRRRPRHAGALLRHVVVRRWRSTESFGENAWAALAAFHLARRVAATGAEVIHATWAGGPATAAWVASRLTGRPYSLAGRAADIHPPDGFLEDKIADAAFVRVEAEANVGYLAGLVPSARSRIHAIYNGVTVNGGAAAAVRMRPPYRLLAVGRFVPKKGFDVLLRACRELRSRGIDVRLTLAGSGRDARRLRRIVRRLGLGAIVTFPGFVPFDGVAALYRDADILVAPCIVDRTGDRDGIPTVIIEALMHRVPVVATDVAGIGEVIEDGVTGRLVAPGDARALADAIAATGGDRVQAIAMAAAGRAKVVTMFDRERNARRLIDLLVSAAAAGRVLDGDARQGTRAS